MAAWNPQASKQPFQEPACPQTPRSQRAPKCQASEAGARLYPLLNAYMKSIMPKQKSTSQTMWYLPPGATRHVSRCAQRRSPAAHGAHPPPPEAYMRFILRSVSRSAACVRSMAPSSSATSAD